MALGGSESRYHRGTLAVSCDWSILWSAENSHMYHVTKHSRSRHIVITVITRNQLLNKVHVLLELVIRNFLTGNFIWQLQLVPLVVTCCHHFYFNGQDDNLRLDNDAESLINNWMQIQNWRVKKRITIILLSFELISILLFIRFLRSGHTISTNNINELFFIRPHRIFIFRFYISLAYNYYLLLF